MLKAFTDTWLYRGYGLATDPSSFGAFAPFVEKWRSKFADDGRLPSWNDFQIEELIEWWGRVSLLRYETEPADICCDLWGTVITDWYGRDYTNERLGQLEQLGQPLGYEAWDDIEKHYFEEMKRGEFIGIAGGENTSRKRFSRSVWSVDLPVRNSMGTLSLLSMHIDTPKGEILEFAADPLFEMKADF